MHNFPRILVIFVTVIAVLAVLTGGNASAGLSFPFITPTQASYLPGDTPIILGYEFQPGQELVIKITRPDGLVVNASGGQGSDSIVVTSSGHFAYSYPPSEIIKGLYYVDAIDSSGAVLASTVFEDHIATDLELYGMPDVGPSARGVGGSDGLVDAIAGRCLVGTVEITATGNDNDIRTFFFDLVVDRQSSHQGTGSVLKNFIDRLERVSTRSTIDHDTGGAADSPGNFFTTGAVITGTVHFTSLDGTVFQVVGPTAGPDPGEDIYRVTVCGAVCPDGAAGNPSAITSARFEYCARININAGDNDNGTDGFITSDPETGGTESSPINVVPLTDTSPPVCVLQILPSGTPCPNGGIAVTLSDPQSGIASVVETRKVNATTSYNPHQPPPLTFSDVTVTACKINPSLSSNLALTVTNGKGLVTKCDPVDFQLVRDDGRPVRHTFPLEVGEGYLHIDNSGLQNFTMNLNGTILVFSTKARGAGVYQIPAYGQVDYDLTEYLVAGQNSVEIKAVGQRGGSARIVIHDIANGN